MQGRKRDTEDRGRGLRTRRGLGVWRKRVGRIERGALTHTPLCVAQTACGRLPRGRGAQPGAVATRGVEGLVREGGEAGRVKEGEGIGLIISQFR